MDAVKGRNVEVYLDGGVRKGTDVFKALALGAKAVFLGRPILWGLAHNVSGNFPRSLGYQGLNDSYTHTFFASLLLSFHLLHP